MILAILLFLFVGCPALLLLAMCAVGAGAKLQFVGGDVAELETQGGGLRQSNDAVACESATMPMPSGCPTGRESTSVDALSYPCSVKSTAVPPTIYRSTP